MDVYGSTQKMSKILSKEKNIRKEYGDVIAKKVKQRITEFRAANNLKDISHVPPQKLHQLSGKYKNCFSVMITGNWRLVFEAYTSDEELTLEKELAVIILVKEIVDYHGN
ncbi:type II toxin-antitoxin system RelE/ParE family toxin [Enterococcus devriesei]|uniref:RelE/StbE family addiction module toxin n=1 Tax=Enterococcus devriesei TaxID=319970 RepID=A0A1L8SVL7_9ENTE|nr:type II toxin-antitoxin system RelE/ParE family toxin [Enterococcus devriesei]OJG36121.1 hypothetical protein RV00_GL002265 [Enterococcus devriesei]